VADIRRLRLARYRSSYGSTLKHHGIHPGTDRAKALAAAIARLRSAERLPLDEDQEVEVWGRESFWVHAFALRLWLYYRTDPTGSDEYVEIIAVRDHVHEQ
jgi:hypothetical protein